MKLKKLLAATLSLVMLLGTIGTVALAEEATETTVQNGTWGGIDWTLDLEGTLTIAPTKGEPVPDKNAPTKRTYAVGEWREAVVYKSNGSASAIGGYPYNVKAVKKLVIEEGVTKIGSFTGQFPNLTGEVIIPSTVTYIGQEAFHKAPMTSLVFAAGGTDPLCIANGAFKKTLIEEVALPGDREYIHVHHWAFGGSTNLKKAYIPANLTKVWGGEHVDYFDNFNSQTNVTWANYGSIFTGCTKMETVTFENEAVRDLFFDKNRNSTDEDYIVGAVGLVAYGNVAIDDMLALVAEGGELLLYNNCTKDIETTGALSILFKNTWAKLTADVILGSKEASVTFNGLTDKNFAGAAVPYGSYTTGPKEDENNNIIYKNYDSILASNGVEFACNFDEALANAVDGDVITLVEDVQYNIGVNPVATIALGDGVIINLNCKTISPADPELPTFVTGEKYVITNGTIIGDVVITAGEVEIKDATIKGDLEVSSGAVTMSGGAITGDVDVADIAAATFSGGEFSVDVTTYVANGYELIRSADGYVVVKSDSTEGKAEADIISVVYELAPEIEGEKVYNIIVKANNDDVINELASVDLTFEFGTPEDDAINFTVAPEAAFSMTRFENSNRYMFNYSGVGSNYEGTASEITVGTITVTGYGKFTIATADVDTNVVNATTVNDNLVDTYTVGGATDDYATTGGLVIEDSVSETIAVPVRDLAINIDFPNAVVDQAIAYQDMKVVISGGDLDEDITIDLGSDAEETALDIFGKADAKFVADMVDGSYVINVTDALTVNTAYTVTVSGAGYRTARYTVTMTEDKTLRFWNNVMDEAQVVEIGKDSSVAKVTFLAGDIVKDNNINIYDLSAVVSYFGTENLVAEHPEYAKYDLNRDGVIDSKDVAYVLVSWNN